MAPVAELQLWYKIKGSTEHKHFKFLCKATGKLYGCQATNIIKILVLLFHPARNTLWLWKWAEGKKAQKPQKIPVMQVCIEHADQHENVDVKGTTGPVQHSSRQWMLCCGKHHFCILWTLRCFLRSHKKWRCKRQSVPAAEKSKAWGHTTPPAMCQEVYLWCFSGKHVSAVMVASLFSISSLICCIR